MTIFFQTHIGSFVSNAVLVSQIVFPVGLVLLFHKDFRNRVYRFVNLYVLWLLLFVSSTAVVGSISLSQIAGFVPCELCWIQRIFLFSQPILLLVAMVRREKSIVSYLLPLSILGAIVSIYHSIVQWGYGGSLLGCTSVGGECAKVYIHQYGYITIPFMAFTTFAYLILISILYYKSRSSKE